MHILEFTETWVYNALQDHFELCRDVNRQVVKKKKKKFASPTILGFRQLKTKILNTFLKIM